MANALGIFLAGGLGCLSRYLVMVYFTPLLGFPVTLIVNVVGGFFAGFVASKLPQLKPLFLAGFLGGFTTFSAFSLDCLAMIQNQEFLSAVLYILASVFLSLAAAWLGWVV
jgi:CrcB protein